MRPGRLWKLPVLSSASTLVEIAGWADAVQGMHGEGKRVLPDLRKADASRIWEAMPWMLLEGAAGKAC